MRLVVEQELVSGIPAARDGDACESTDRKQVPRAQWHRRIGAVREGIPLGLAMNPTLPLPIAQANKHDAQGDVSNVIGHEGAKRRAPMGKLTIGMGTFGSIIDRWRSR